MNIEQLYSDYRTKAKDASTCALLFLFLSWGIYLVELIVICLVECVVERFGVNVLCNRTVEIVMWGIACAPTLICAMLWVYFSVIARSVHNAIKRYDRERKEREKFLKEQHERIMEQEPYRSLINDLNRIAKEMSDGEIKSNFYFTP